MLRRARRLPVGHARNDLRQLASGLLWLDKRNREATLQDRVNAILALIDSRSLAQPHARKNADIERVATAVFEVRQAVAADAPSTRKPRFSSCAFIIALLARPAIESLHPSVWRRFRVFLDLEICADIRNALRDCRSFILEIEHVPLAVDDLPISRDWRVDAGAALSIDQFDGLRDVSGYAVHIRVLRAFVRRNLPGPSERSISADVGPC